MSTFNELIDFTRSTTGTYLDSVVYGEELVTNGTFDNNIDGWSVTGSAALGAWNAGKYIDLDRNGGTSCVLAQPVSGTGVSFYEVSFDVVHIDNGTKIATTFGGVLLDATVGAVGTYKFYGFATGSPSTLFFSLTQTSAAVASLGNISVKEVIGGQVSGTPLLRTAAINEPRLEYDASGNPLGLLIEEARANQAKHSEDWTLYPWTLRENSFSSSTNSIAPDGTAGATRFYTNSNVPAFLQQSCGGNVGAKTHTVSCWVRSTNGGADQTFRLKCTHSGVTDFFSNDKTATSEWKRFTFTETFISASNTAVIAGVVEDSSTNQFDIEVWGMQVEFDASFPTSYIPTSGSTVTRAKDIASLPVEKFAYNQDQGSIVCHFNYFFESGNSKRTYEFSDALSANVIRMLDHNNVNQLQANVKFGGAGVAGILINAPTMLSGVKTFQSYKLNGYSGGADGTLAGTDSNGALPIGINKLSIGSNRVGGATMNGHITSLQYYPKQSV